MSGQPNSPVFLERASYKRRRLIDAARLLPVLGALLWAIPLLWRSGEGTSNATALMYVFGVWVLLIVFGALIVHRLQGTSEPSKPENLD